MKRGDTDPERVLILHRASFTELCPRVIELVRALDWEAVIADKVHLKGSYRAEFKLRCLELFVERSKKTPSLNSASLSTRIFSRSLDEVTLTITREIRPVHAKPAGFTAVRWSRGSTPRKYAAHDTYSLIFLVHTRRQTELTKEGRSKWRFWPLRPAVSCTCDGADWPKVVAVGAQQPISDFFFCFIQMRDTVSTNGEHLRVAEVKSFPAISKPMRSVNGDQNGANLKKWSVLLVCTISPLQAVFHWIVKGKMRKKTASSVVSLGAGAVWQPRSMSTVKLFMPVSDVEKRPSSKLLVVFLGFCVSFAIV